MRSPRPDRIRLSLIVIVLVLTGCSAPAPSKFDVGGRSLFIHCVGQGSPVIVLDSGSPGDASNWVPLLPDLQRLTRTCVYDRAGQGASDPGPTPTTSQRSVDDLHALLERAGVPGPYVLVGWSYGGLNMRLYADQYAGDVVGLVLVDSSHPDQSARFLEALPPESPDESPAAHAQRADWAGNTIPLQFNLEGVDWATSTSQVREVQSLGDLPLVVVTAGLSYWPDFAPGDAAALHDAWQAMQRDLVQLSSRSTQIIASESYHCVHCSQPRLVIDAIRGVVDSVQRP